MTRHDYQDYLACVARFHAVCRVAERWSADDWGKVLAGLPQEREAILASKRERLAWRDGDTDQGGQPTD